MYQTSHGKDHEECDHIINIFQNGNKSHLRGNLYLGSVHTLFDDRFKQQLKIDCVLTVIDQNNYESFQIKQNVQKQFVSHHKWINIQDLQQLSIYPYLHDTHKYIREMLEQTNVLVHCRVGKSRSASLVIGFLIKEYRMSFAQAKKYTKQRRNIIKPNYGFIDDLLRFQQEISINREKIPQN